jgi:hypothetical protein
MPSVHILSHCAASTLLAAISLPVFAQDTPSVAREAKNPLANLINLQFLYDANLNIGSEAKTQDVFTLQPVIPFSVSANWSVITRTILPLITQPGLSAGEGRTRGPGDTQFSAFLSPARAGRLVWGIGPVFQIPSASNEALGQGKWGAGPTAAAQWSGELWTFGALINNIWSFAGDDSRPAVNQMQVQPEVNYNFRRDPDGYFTFSPTITANWKQSGGERWTVPVSLGVGQLVKIGKQSVNLQATAYYNVVAPADSPNWTLELEVQFLFPQ